MGAQNAPSGTHEENPYLQNATAPAYGVLLGWVRDSMIANVSFEQTKAKKGKKKKKREEKKCFSHSEFKAPTVPEQVAIWP